MTAKKTCRFIHKNDQGNKCLCNHRIYKNHECCIFHHANIKEKEKEFEQELNRFIINCEKDESIQKYNFRGFIFPLVNFSRKKFKKIVCFKGCQFSGDASFFKSQFLENADFRESQFSGNADFRESQFSGNAFFRESQFSGDASFLKSQFSSDVYFLKSQFSGYSSFSETKFFEDAIFSESQFSGDVSFRGSKFSGISEFRRCKFFGNTYFNESQFSKDGEFRECQFLGDAEFNRSQFSGDAEFSGSKFEKRALFRHSKHSDRANFANATFNDEINFEEAEILFLKNLDTEQNIKINFSKAILEQSHFYKIDSIADCNFSEAFLLSISFADKKIINCDFTGAVFDSVRTRGWEPDQVTLKKTKYIYTDHTVESYTDESENEVKKFKPKLDSIVPADGYFGEGENKKFTIGDYLKEPFKWNLAFAIPQRFRTASTNFFQFFSDFMRATEGIDVEVRTKKEGDKLRLEFITDEKEHKEIIQQCFDHYLSNSNKNPQDAMLSLHFKNSEMSDTEVAIFKIQYEHQLSTLNLNFNYTKQLLEEKEKTNKSLTRQIDLLEKFHSSPHSIMKQSQLPLASSGNAIIKIEQKQNTQVSNTNTINNDINIKNEFPNFKDSFEELFGELKNRDAELDAKFKEIQNALDSISGKSDSKELNYPMNKLSRIFRKLEDKSSKFYNIVKSTQKGIELAQKTAFSFNKIAQWIGIPDVSTFFM